MQASPKLSSVARLVRPLSEGARSLALSLSVSVVMRRANLRGKHTESAEAYDMGNKFRETRSVEHRRSFMSFLNTERVKIGRYMLNVVFSARLRPSPPTLRTTRKHRIPHPYT